MVNLLQGEKVNVATLTAKVLNLSSLLDRYILLHVFTLLSSLFLAPNPPHLTGLVPMPHTDN